MILVAGSTGLVGGQICLDLAKVDRTVRALVRSTSDRTELDTLKGHGIELAEGDLKNWSYFGCSLRRRSNVPGLMATANSIWSRLQRLLGHRQLKETLS